MADLRLLEIKERNPMAFGVKEIISTLVAGGILFMVGLYAYSKVTNSVDVLNGGDYINSSYYCSGSWNGTVCSGGTVLDLPAEYTTQVTMRENITSGFDLGSVVFIVVAAAAIIGVIMIAFR